MRADDRHRCRRDAGDEALCEVDRAAAAGSDGSDAVEDDANVVDDDVSTPLLLLLLSLFRPLTKKIEKY